MYSQTAASLLQVEYLLAVSLSKVDDYHTHVVATLTLSAVEVGRQEGIEKSLANLGQLDLALHLDVDIVNYLLGGLCFPDAIAAKNGKIRL